MHRLANAAALVVAMVLWAVAVESQTTAAPTPPPPPTYPRDVAVLPTPQSYPDAVAAARRWRNSSLLVVKSADENNEAREALRDEGVQRGWLGAYRDANANAFFWTDGVRVGDPSRPFTNWAPDRPVADTVGTAIAVDMASGLWFDLAQGTLNTAVVDTPAREVTRTLPLPGFEFPPGVPAKPVVPPWQTAVIVACSLMTIVLLGATAGLWVWHFGRPIRADNRSGFVVEPPPDKAPPEVLAQQPPVLPHQQHDQSNIAEPLRYNAPDAVRATREALGKPLDLGPMPSAAGGGDRQLARSDGSGGSRTSRASSVGRRSPSNRSHRSGSAGSRHSGSRSPGSGHSQRSHRSHSRTPSVGSGSDRTPSVYSDEGSHYADDDVEDEEAVVEEPAPAPPPPRPLPKAKALPAPLAARKLPQPAVAGTGNQPPTAGPARKLPQSSPVGGAKQPPGPKRPPPGPAAGPARKLPPSSTVGGAAKGPPARKLPPSAPVGQKKKAAAAPVAGRKLPPARPV